MTLYLLHYKRVAFPVLDFGLLRLKTMRAAIVGGFLFRLGIGSLAVPAAAAAAGRLRPDAVSVRA